MTLVVCRKDGDNIFIQSDSMVTQDFGGGLEREMRHNRPLAGLLKTVFLHPHVCLSFAGHTHPITQFLKEFIASSLSDWNTKKLVGVLRDLHNRSNGECEFILCEAVNRVPQITVVKDRKIQSDLSSAWIGSHDAFEAYQAAFHGLDSGEVHDRMREAFRTVIDNPDIPEVGHFHVESYLDHEIDNSLGSIFLYEMKLEIETGSELQNIEAGIPTALTLGRAEFGAYGTSYFRSVSPVRHGIAVHFPHARFGVLLCPQVDCEKPILLQNCSAEEFMGIIWDRYKIAMEGLAMVSDTRLRLLRNYPR